jgi:biofilm protein TabA
MNVGELKQLRAQIALTPNMRKALDFLEHAPAAEFAGLPDGKIDIDGDKVFALVQSYKTAAAGDPVVFEVHRQYIDVQYVAAGDEVMAWASTEGLPATAEYEAAKEAWFAAKPLAETTLLRLAAGELAIFYPTDAHAPRLAAGEPAPVKKIVVKVAVES